MSPQDSHRELIHRHRRRGEQNLADPEDKKEGTKSPKNLDELAWERCVLKRRNQRDLARARAVKCDIKARWCFSPFHDPTLRR